MPVPPPAPPCFETPAPMIRNLVLRLLAPVAGPSRLTLLVALAFGVTSLGLLAVPRSALGWDTNTFSSGSETLLISLQNQARSSAGLRSLKQDTALRTVARWRSKDMAERNYFSHTIKGTDRKVFWYLEHTYDYCFKLAGENIGTVNWEGASEEDATKWVFKQFMGSSTHRGNILGKTWDVVAVGAWKTTGDTFIWTVLFADRCGTTAPKATPRPTPKPSAKPKPTPKPTPRPRATLGPTLKPAPRATERPTATPTPGPVLTPTVSPSAPTTPVRTPVPSASPSPTPRSQPVPSDHLRILDPPAPDGLVDSIMQSIAVQFFGS